MRGHIIKKNLHSWQDFASKCTCFGGVGVNTSSNATSRLVRS